MRRLRRAPLWVRIAFVILVVTLGAFLGGLVDHIVFQKHEEDLTDILVGSIGRGVTIGPCVVVFSICYNRRAARVTQIDNPDELRTVIRASTRGPIPADPRLRRAARDLAEDQLEQRLMTRPFAAFFIALFAVAFAAAAIFWSPWFIVAVLVVLALIAAMWMAPRRLQRRIDLLAEPDRYQISPSSNGQP